MVHKTCVKSAPTPGYTTNMANKKAAPKLGANVTQLLHIDARFIPHIAQYRRVYAHEVRPGDVLEVPACKVRVPMLSTGGRAIELEMQYALVKITATGPEAHEGGPGSEWGYAWRYHWPDTGKRSPRDGGEKYPLRGTTVLPYCRWVQRA